MPLKVIHATEAKPGTTIIIDGSPCIVRNMDVSKTGKHGHSKCRIEAIDIMDGNKKVLAIPGHHKFDVPLVLKRRAQVLSVHGEISNIMDLESYETLDVKIAEELKGEIETENQVEYWDIDGKKIIKRKF